MTFHRSSTPLRIALTSLASSWTCPRSGRTAAAADPPSPSTRCGDSLRRWRDCSGRQGSRFFSCELSKRHLITKTNWGRNSHFKKRSYMRAQQYFRYVPRSIFLQKSRKGLQRTHSHLLFQINYIEFRLHRAAAARQTVPPPPPSPRPTSAGSFPTWTAPSSPPTGSRTSRGQGRTRRCPGWRGTWKGEWVREVHLGASYQTNSKSIS